MLAAALLQSCAAAIPATFDGRSAQYALEKGANEISGNAMTISSTGYVRTCEGSGVLLLPVVPYWTAWKARIFGTQDEQYASRIDIEKTPIDEAARKVTRSADCDSKGHFAFENVADGRYYVFSTIYWLLRWQQNGGGLIEEVEVHGGRKAVVSMTKDWQTRSGSHNAIHDGSAGGGR